MRPTSLVLAAMMVLRLAGGQFLGGLSCQPSDRHGRRLGRWKPVLPNDCRLPDAAGHGAFCDTPGKDYPWEAIDRYLQRSKDVLKKRVEALAAAEASRQNSLHRRRTRSTDVTDSDVIAAIARDPTSVSSGRSRDTIDGQVHEDDLESSGDGDSDIDKEDSNESATTAGGDHDNLSLPENSTEGSGHHHATDSQGTDSADKRDGEEMAILVSFFTHHSGETVSKEAIKDMLAFKKTFKRPVRVPSTSSPPHEDEVLPAENPDDLIVAETIRREVVSPSPSRTPQSTDDSTSNRSRQGLLPEVKYYHPTTHSTAEPILKLRNSSKSDSSRTSIVFPSRTTQAETENREYLPPRAEFLVARPPSIVEFNRKTSTFPVRKRVPSQRTRIPSRSTSALPRRTTRAPVHFPTSPSHLKTHDKKPHPPQESTSHPPRTSQTFDHSSSTSQVTPRPSTQQLHPPVTPPTTWDEELNLFTETVYAESNDTKDDVVYTTAIYGDDVKADVTRASTPTSAALVSTTSKPPQPSSTTTTPDPYTEAACEYRVEVLSPFYAMNTRQEWKTLINIPTYETFIHMEHCAEEKSQGRCAAGCRCTQKFSIRTMPVYDTNEDGCDVIYMDKFAFPSHCDCTCRPAHLMFGVTRPPTTLVVTSSEKPQKQSFNIRPTESNQSPNATKTIQRNKSDTDELKKASAITPPMRRRPNPVKSRPGVPLPTRRRPVSMSRATLVPQQTQMPVPPRIPIVPSSVPAPNHRNRFRGPVRSAGNRPPRTTVV